MRRQKDNKTIMKFCFRKNRFYRKSENQDFLFFKACLICLIKYKCLHANKI